MNAHAVILHAPWAAMPRELLFNLGEFSGGAAVISAAARNLAEMLCTGLMREQCTLSQVLGSLDATRDEY